MTEKVTAKMLQNIQQWHQNKIAICLHYLISNNADLALPDLNRRLVGNCTEGNWFRLGIRFALAQFQDFPFKENAQDNLHQIKATNQNEYHSK